jgi:glycosyltransferase involved in cell wall biosynthesis
MATLANGLSRGGHAVDLVCVRARGPFLREVDPDVRIVDLGASKSILAAAPLIRYLRATRPTALLSTLVNVNLAAALARTASPVSVRFVARETTHASVDNRTGWLGDYRLVALLRRWTYRQADHIVAPSQGVARDLVLHVGVPRSRITVIANPLDLDRIDRAAMEPAPHFEALPRGTRVVLSVGRLSAEKDLGTLVRAFARVHDRTPTALVLLGDGDERRRLERLAVDLGVSSALLMPGFVDNPFAYLKRASVFVLSSRYEGMPNTLLQALATGTPVVSTDCPSGPRELLDDGRWGRLVPVGDHEAMAQALADALDGRVATAPRAIIAERFGLDTIVEQYRRVLFDA